MEQPMQISASPLLKRKTVIIERGLVVIERTSIRPKFGDVQGREIKELSELPFTLPDLFFRQLALNSHTREMGYLCDYVLISRAGTSWFPIVHGKGFDHFAFREEDELRPTGPQRMCQGKLAIIDPQWIVSDIGDDHLFAQVSSGATRTHQRTNLASINGIGISLRQAGCAAVP